MKHKIGLLGALCSGVCALVVLAGCSNEVAGTALPASTGSTAKSPTVPTPTVVPAPPGGSSGSAGLVDWMNGFCDAFAPVLISSPEDFDFPEVPENDIAGQKMAASETLSQFEGLLTPAVAKFKQLPPAPHPQAEEAKTSFLTTFGPFPGLLKQSKTLLDSAPPDDRLSLKQAAETLLAVIDVMPKRSEPLKKIEANRELSGAWDQASNCKKIPN